MANIYTALCIGIQQYFTTLGARCFEPDQTAPVQYVSNRGNLEFLGTKYDAGQNLPFDVGGTSYSATALAYLQLYWNQGWIYPTT